MVCAAAAMHPNRLAAIFPPWWSEAAVLAAASSEADVVAGGGLPFVVAVASSDGDLAARMRRAGALFVADRSAFGLCLTDPSDVQ